MGALRIFQEGDMLTQEQRETILCRVGWHQWEGSVGRFAVDAKPPKTTALNGTVLSRRTRSCGICGK